MKSNTEWLNRIFDKLHFAYEIEMSNYAASREIEKQYQRAGLKEIDEAITAIQQHLTDEMRGMLEGLLEKSQSASFNALTIKEGRITSLTTPVVLISVIEAELEKLR